MIRSLQGKKILAWVVAGFMGVLSLRQEGRAMLVPADLAAPQAAAAARQADLFKIQKSLENKIVRQRLADIGLSDSEIQKRLNSLSDKDVHQLASRIDSIAPGGDDGAGVIIGLLLVVLLVVLIIYLIKRV